MATNDAPTDTTMPVEGARVFIGNMNFQTKEPEMLDFVTKHFKAPKSSNMIFHGQRPMGYAFVDFESAEVAEKAVVALNGKILEERELKVEVARPLSDRTSEPRRGRGARRGRRPSVPRNRGPASDTVIYLGNLAYATTADDIAAALKDYAVEEIRLVCYAHNGRSKGFAFVTAKDHEAQKKILADLVSFELGGRKVTARAAYSEEPHQPAVDESAAN